VLEAAVGIRFLSAASVVVRRVKRATSAARRGANGIVGVCFFCIFFMLVGICCTAEGIATRIGGVGGSLGVNISELTAHIAMGGSLRK
jgi:hypothetical protein